ncbi:MAG: ABC transporter substrate-binding protein [Gammaproteobacteria bacterium]|nr:ABC transporter substrate-binding protein [Gammaproteobacteria bacterium]
MKRVKFCLGIVLSLLLAACDQSTTFEEKDVVRLYTSVPLSAMKEIKRVFEKAHPSVSLSIHRAGTSKLMKQLDQEAQAGEMAADVIWVADFSNAEYLKRKGLLQPYQSEQLKGVFPLFKDPEHYYVGSRLLNMVIVYNSNAVSKLPRSYRDLLAPQWQGRVGLVNPATSGSSLYTIGTLLQHPQYGEKYVHQLLNNHAVLVAKNNKLVEKVASGELCMGIAIDFVARNFRTENPQLSISYIYPRNGTVVVPSPIAITRDAKNVKAAQKLVDWVISKEGQTMLSKTLGMVSVRSDVPSPRGMVSLRDLTVVRSNPQQLAEHRNNIKQELNEFSQSATARSCN